MDKKILNNYIYSILYQTLILIIPFITIPYISRNLSSSEFGIYNYSLTIVTYFMFISSMGLHIYGQKQIAISKTEKDRNSIFVNIFILRLVLVLFFEITYLIFTYIFFKNRDVYFLQSINLIASAFDISWYYAGIEDFRIISKRNIFIKMAFVILLFVLVKNNNILMKYIFVISIMNLIGNLSMFMNLSINFSCVQLNYQQIKKYLKSSIVLLIPSLVIQLSSIVDKTILGFLSNMSEIGYYSQVFKLLNIFIVIVSSYGTVIFPRMITANNNDDKEKLKKLVLESLSFVIHLSLPCMIGLIITSNLFCTWFFGENYIGIEFYLLIGVVLILIQAVSGILGTQLMMATSNEKKLISFILVGVFLNISLDIILIPFFGGKGAIIASIISELSILILAIINFKKTIGGNIISKSILKAVIASLILFIILSIIKYFLHYKTIISLLILIISGIIVYVVLCFVLKDSFVEELIKMIKKK